MLYARIFELEAELEADQELIRDLVAENKALKAQLAFARSQYQIVYDNWMDGK